MRRLLIGVCVLAAGVFLLCPKQAEARRRGIIIITHGESIKHVADFPGEGGEILRQLSGKEMTLGYKYNSFGVFWLDLWTWDGEHCLYDGEKGYKMPASQLALMMGTSEDELPKPFFYRFPPGLIIIVLGIAIWVPFAIRGRRRNKELAKRFETLMGDARYKEALDVFSEQAKADEPAEGATAENDQPAQTGDPSKPDPFDAAVEHLVKNGVDREEAKENFGFLLSVLVAHAESEAA